MNVWRAYVDEGRSVRLVDEERGMRKIEMQDGGPSRAEGKPSEAPLAGEPSEDETTLLNGDELEIIGDLGGEFDDPEGWMSERSGYWMQMPVPPPPTRAAFIRHRINELFDIACSWKSGSAPAWPATRIADTQWRGLADSVFGLGVPAEIDDGISSIEKQPAPSCSPEANGFELSSGPGAKTAGTADFEKPARRAAKASATPSNAQDIGEAHE
jgi:hypothetical protein